MSKSTVFTQVSLSTLLLSTTGLAGPAVTESSATPALGESSAETSLVPLGGQRKAPWLSPRSLNETLDLNYQIGDEWGKLPVTAEDLGDTSPAFRRASLATARVGGATGFVLGEFGGEVVVATNNHVLPRGCSRGQIRFPLLGISAPCQDFLGTWPDIDLSLITLDIEGEERETLLEVAANFDFSDFLYPGQTLLTAGFGIAENLERNLMVNQDMDCIVLSGAEESRFMEDPDAFNPGEDQVWSFSNGCDVSHGDSGSAMVDRESGRVIGIIWTGKIPKDEKVQSSEFVQDLLVNPTEDIWSEMSYGVPAYKMFSFIQETAETTDNPDTARILLDLLGLR